MFDTSKYMKYDTRSHQIIESDSILVNEFSKPLDDPLVFAVRDPKTDNISLYDIELRKFICVFSEKSSLVPLNISNCNILSVNSPRSRIALSKKDNTLWIVNCFKNSIEFSTAFKAEISQAIFLDPDTLFVCTNAERPENQNFLIDLNLNKITNIEIGTSDSKIKYQPIKNSNDLYFGIYSENSIHLFNKLTHDVVFSDQRPLNLLNRSLNSVSWYPYYPNSLLLVYSDGSFLIYHLPSAKIIRSYELPQFEIKQSHYYAEFNILIIITNQNVFLSVEFEAILEYNSKMYRFKSLGQEIPEDSSRIIVETAKKKENTKTIDQTNQKPSDLTLLHQYGGYQEDNSSRSLEKSITLQFLQNIASVYFDFNENNRFNVFFNETMRNQLQEFKIRLNPTFNIEEFTIVCLYLRSPILISKIIESQ